MPFDPSGFLGAASRATSGSDEADFRTAVGRAYYAAYGTMRTRLCAAKGVSARKLFDRAGRHHDLVRPMGLQSAFKILAPAYHGLLTGRIKADYDYQASVDRATASGAVSSAQVVVDALGKIDDQHFVKFPLAPKNP